VATKKDVNPTSRKNARVTEKKKKKKKKLDLLKFLDSLPTELQWKVCTIVSIVDCFVMS
jgi:hypothetical protein